jgi:hypothetical protein
MVEWLSLEETLTFNASTGTEPKHFDLKIYVLDWTIEAVNSLEESRPIHIDESYKESNNSRETQCENSTSFLRYCNYLENERKMRANPGLERARIAKNSG